MTLPEMAEPTLRLEPITEVSSSLRRLFASNVEHLRSAEGEYTDAEPYLARERAMPESRCFALRINGADELIGFLTTALDPRERVPWIGLLLVDRTHQRCGVGAEAVRALEGQLAAEGWHELRLAVLQTNEAALRFWQRQGYVHFREGVNEGGFAVHALRKVIGES